MSMASSIILRPIHQWQNKKKLAAMPPSGINETKYVKIGGIEQFMTIRGQNRENPVLLFIHGGPGATQTVFNTLTLPWEKYFTVVQYDQRGSGKTLRRNGELKPRELSLAKLEADGIEVAEYLREYLKKDKLILVASSVGSTFGTAMAAHRPDLFYAYVGTDQNSTPDAQTLSYELTIKWLKQYGKTKELAKAEAIGPDHAHWTKKQFDDMVNLTLAANPTIPNMVFDVIFPAMMSSPIHTMRDIQDVAKGIDKSMEQLYGELVDFDARKLGLDFKIPFFVFQGDTDAVTPTAMAKAYFDMINAPKKEFVLIKKSGHMAAFTRPEQFLDELVKRVRPLAK